MKVTAKELETLIVNKLMKAGLKEEHAQVVADVLVHADARGYHSHGAMRVEYYAERIAKGGINTDPEIQFEKNGPAAAIFEGDNGVGHFMAKKAMEEAIAIAKENGIAVVGVRNISHSGALSYFVEQAADEGLIGISVCQSDPMVVPLVGLNLITERTPLHLLHLAVMGRKLFLIWPLQRSLGKILYYRSKNEPIPDSWAVDENGESTTDPFKVKALLPIAGPKGYGLMMMVDILSGVLLGLPHGKHVTSMYEDLTEYRKLGQLHIVINPAFFTSADLFKEKITTSMEELNQVKPKEGYDRVSYPGQRSEERAKKAYEDGIEIVDEIYEYLVSDVVHNNQYDNKDPFAK